MQKGPTGQITTALKINWPNGLKGDVRLSYVKLRYVRLG